MSSRYANADSLFLEPKVTQHGGHMVMTNVHKPTKVKYLCLDTTFADDAGVGGALPLASAPRVLQLSDRVSDATAISVLSMELPVSFHGVSAALGNNSLTLVDASGVARVATVADGTYTAATVAAAVNAALAAAGAGAVVFSLSGSQSKLTSSGGVYTLYLDALSALPDKSPALRSRLGWLLGFRRAAQALAAGGSIVSPAWLDLGGPRYLYLALDDFANGAPNSMLSPVAGSALPRSVIARVSMDAARYPAGSVVHAFQNDGSLVSDTRRYSAQVDFRKVRVQVVNCFGAPVDFNGLPFSFVLQVEHL